MCSRASTIVRRLGAAQDGTGEHGPMDEGAIAALRDLYSDLEIDGRVLDLGGGGAGHFDVPPDDLVDADPDEPLPYGDKEFDDVLCSGRVGALTRPHEAFV